jgi:plastocyanin
MYMGYNPSVIVIRAGDTVVWKALDGPHTVTSVNVTPDGKTLFDHTRKCPFRCQHFSLDLVVSYLLVEASRLIRAT